MPSQLMLPVVVMIRHAQSEWNREGRFTGWADPALTDAGRDEAIRAAHSLADAGYSFDRVHTSRLQRAQETADIVLRHSGNAGVPVSADWRLNERHYGALQGEDKIAMADRVGEDQVWRWRRGYLERPPRLLDDDPAHPSRDPRWADIDPRRLPNSESLAATRARAMDFWDEVISPQIIAGKRLMIASHGNTLRALIMALHDMSVAEVEDFEIPTGVPIVYVFSPKGEAIGWHYLDHDAAQAA